MSLPLLTLYQGQDRDVLLVGPTNPPDLSLYEEVRVTCAALALTLSSASPTQLELQNGGVDVLLHIRVAHLVGKPLGVHGYQLEARTGTLWYDVAEQGPIQLLAHA